MSSAELACLTLDVLSNGFSGDVLPCLRCTTKRLLEPLTDFTPLLLRVLGLYPFYKNVFQFLKTLRIGTYLL